MFFVCFWFVVVVRQIKGVGWECSCCFEAVVDVVVKRAVLAVFDLLANRNAMMCPKNQN